MDEVEAYNTKAHLKAQMNLGIIQAPHLFIFNLWNLPCCKKGPL